MLPVVLGGIALAVQVLAWQSGSVTLLAAAAILWLAAFLAKALADWLPLAGKGDSRNGPRRTDSR